MPFRREYLCLECGKIRRADGQVSDPNIHVPLPECCNSEMKQLEEKGAVAARQLDPQKRIEWYLAGCHYARRGGKRQWIPVMDESKCKGCHHGRER